MLERWALVQESKGNTFAAEHGRTLLRQYGDVAVPIEGESEIEARERSRFGGDFYGVKEVQEALETNLTPDQAPPIDGKFTEEELARALELDQMLYLAVDRVGEIPLTMKWLQSAIAPKVAQERKGKLLYSAGWYEEEPFYTAQTPKAEWKLASKGVLVDPKDPNNPSTSKNYLQQTQFLSDYVTQVVFKGQQMPEDIARALKQFNRQKGNIQAFMDKRDWKTAADKLARLQVNQLLRERPVEGLYLHTLMLRSRGQRRLVDKYVWTAEQSADGGLVGFGYGGGDGVDVSSYWPGDFDYGLGVSLSR